jgi:hypothetical protein
VAFWICVATRKFLFQGEHFGNNFKQRKNKVKKKQKTVARFMLFRKKSKTTGCVCSAL